MQNWIYKYRPWILKVFPLISLCILLNCNCTQIPREYRPNVEPIQFCDLPKHIGELVYIESIYSGVEEYWSISGKEKCKPEISSELVFSNPRIYDEYDEQFQKVHSNYWNSFLELKLIGRFENSKAGYGHLGNNNSKFTVEKIVSVKVVERKEP